jgi:hypothetical protein
VAAFCLAALQNGLVLGAIHHAGGNAFARARDPSSTLASVSGRVFAQGEQSVLAHGGGYLTRSVTFKERVCRLNALQDLKAKVRQTVPGSECRRAWPPRAGERAALRASAGPERHPD